MKIYIATPVNARKEVTLEEKRQAAYDRMCEIRKKLRKRYPDAEFHSSFDEHIAPIRKDRYDVDWSESVIMGRCVTEVIQCDMIVLDYDWQMSKGCRLENRAAQIYGVKGSNVWLLGIEKENI